MSSALKLKSKWSDYQVEILINNLQNEPSLWNSEDCSYGNCDARKAALRRLSVELNGLDIGNLSRPNACYTPTCRPIIRRSHLESALAGQALVTTLTYLLSSP